MKTFDRNNHSKSDTPSNNRREFLKNGIILGTISGVAGLSLMTGCNDETAEEISPAEDLMREHGLLNRVLLIYDTCRVHLINGEEFPMAALQDSANIIRKFIEEYHEKLEEDFIFPRFIKANRLTDLVAVLKEQHLAGRSITGQIIGFGKMPAPDETVERQKLIKLLSDFNNMYRPHEAREDTVLFPELRKIISGNEYFALGEDFEKKENELFGEGGFESNVEKVAVLEKQLDIYDLAKFTPANK